MAGRNERNLDISDYIEKEINKETRIVSIKLLQGLVLNSPVDTGIFRGGWLVSVEKPNYAQVQSSDKSGGGTISSGINIIATAQVTSFPTIYLQNRQPYSYRLMELGWSDQAPPRTLSKEIKKATNS